MHFSLADIVTDIIQNSVESGADKLELHIDETPGPNGSVDSPCKREFRFTVKDNGRGMSPEELKQAEDPFYSDGIKHPWRRVGLGIPFMLQTAELSGGGWDIKSEKKAGTTVSAWFDLDNLDTPPVGDIPGLLRSARHFDGIRELMIYTKGVRQYG